VVKSNVVYIYLVNLLIIKRLLNFKSLVNVTIKLGVLYDYVVNLNQLCSTTYIKSLRDLGHYPGKLVVNIDSLREFREC